MSGSVPSFCMICNNKVNCYCATCGLPFCVGVCVDSRAHTAKCMKFTEEDKKKFQADLNLANKAVLVKGDPFIPIPTPSFPPSNFLYIEDYAKSIKIDKGKAPYKVSIVKLKYFMQIFINYLDDSQKKEIENMMKLTLDIDAKK